MRKLILNAYNLWLLIEVKLHHTPESLSNINSDFCGTCDAQEMFSVLGLDRSSRDLTFDGMFFVNWESSEQWTDYFCWRNWLNAFDTNWYSTRSTFYNSFIFSSYLRLLKIILPWLFLHFLYSAVSWTIHCLVSIHCK